jgi:iron complex transport system substrate-binding protein
MPGKIIFILLSILGLLIACGSPATPTTGAPPTVVALNSASSSAVTPRATTVQSSPRITPTTPNQIPVGNTTAIATVPSPLTTAPRAASATAGDSPPAARPTLPVTVKDKDGRDVTITAIGRIIPLNGDVAEIVFALGLGSNVIATDTSATYPVEAQRLPKIGYQRTLNAEGILALKPSVVIGLDSAGPTPVLEQLRSAGVPVYIFSAPATLDGPLIKIRAVGAALGVADTAEALAARTKADIDSALALAAKAASKPTVMFLYLRGTQTQQIGGQGSAADTLIAAAGGIDAGTTAGITNYKPLTAEAIIAGQPQIILVLSAGLQSIGGVDGLLQIPGLAQTPAGRERRVLDYDDLYLLGFGPRTGQALRDLILGLHPELR